MPAVAVESVTKQYGELGAQTTALSELSLRIEPGEFVAVMGPSGCGKTTLLNLIAGLDTPTSGRVVVTGHDLAALSDDERSDLRLRAIGIVFQNFNLLPTFTVEENVAWPLEVMGESWRAARARAGALLDQVGVSAAARTRRPVELSGGEQQRVAIARAIAKRPDVLLCDEPTGALDSRTGVGVLAALEEVNSAFGTTTIVITHNIAIAAMADRVMYMADGQIARVDGNKQRARPEDVRW